MLVVAEAGCRSVTRGAKDVSSRSDAGRGVTSSLCSDLAGVAPAAAAEVASQ